MWYDQIKPTYCLLLLLILLSCSDRNTSNGKSETTVENLYSNIENQIASGKWNEATILIDSLNSAYPDELDYRRKTMLLRAKAIEGMVRDSIPFADEEIARTEEEIKELSTCFITVKEKGLPDFEIDKNASKVNILSGNVLQPRIENNGNSWVLVVSTKGNINIKGLEANIDNSLVSIDVGNPELRRVTGSGVEMFTFSAEELAPLVEAMNNNDPQTFILNIIGEKAKVAIKVSPDMQTAILRTARLVELNELHRKALVRRELLERKLIIAQNQIVNFQ